ncbi:MAG: WG repeat-containing protein [Cyclobacteriaceae bacterium]
MNSHSLKGLVQYLLAFGLFTMLGLNISLADKTKSAFKALEKGEFDKVEEILQKSLEKEKVNPASKYVYSILYCVDSFARYNIDTAHFYIQQAEQDFSSLDEKEVDALAKDEVTLEVLGAQHERIDSLGFGEAQAANTLQSYDYFIEKFQRSIQFNAAVEARNSVAFHHAQQEASWQSYKGFIDQYPEADQIETATEEYNRLIFEEKTQSGGLQELQDFLVSHPNTPYRDILEKRIFGLMSEFGVTGQILDFVKKYENPELQKRGINVAYSIDPNARDLFDLLNQSKWRQLRDSIASIKAMDSITWLPFYEDDKYTFANSAGDLAFDFVFDQISERYYCGNVKDRVLDVAMDKKHLLVNRSLDTIYAGSFDSHVELEYGLLKISKGKKVGVIHTSGFSVLPLDYEDVSVLNKNFLITKSDGEYGIVSLLGKEILKPEFNDIYLSDEYLVIEKEDRIAIYLTSEFLEQAQKETLKPEFKYDDFEILEDWVIAFLEDGEELLDQNLQVVIPMGEQEINTRFDNWLVKQSDGYRLFDKSTKVLGEDVYQQVRQNDQWLAVKGANSWSLYSKSLPDVPMVGLDSVNLLGEDIALVFRNDEGTAIFPNKKTVNFLKDEKLRSIGSGKNTDVHYLVIGRNGKNTLYKNGERIIESVYEIGYISDRVFSAKSRGEYGAMDTKARLIMRIRYDVIGEAENGISPVLYNGRFGAYNFNDRVLISLKFDEKLKPFNDRLLITKFRGKKGLCTILNENVLDTEYDEIIYWSDSTALLKFEGEWLLKGVYTEDEILGGMQDFEFISKDKENMIIKYRTATGLGVYSSKYGKLFEPTFHGIMNLGTPSQPLYFCEKSVREAGFYVAVYIDQKGNTIRSHAYREEEYEGIVCEDF